MSRTESESESDQPDEQPRIGRPPDYDYETNGLPRPKIRPPDKYGPIPEPWPDTPPSAVAAGYKSEVVERKKALREKVRLIARSDPETVREAILPEVLPDTAAALIEAVTHRNRYGQPSAHTRFGIRQVLQMAKLVDSGPQVAIAVFAKLGVKDEEEAARIIGRAKEAESQPLAQTVNQAAQLIRDWIQDHPADRSRLMSVAFGARDASSA